jgi:hypothetical protein
MLVLVMMKKERKLKMETEIENKETVGNDETKGNGTTESTKDEYAYSVEFELTVRRTKLYGPGKVELREPSYATRNFIYKTRGETYHDISQTALFNAIDKLVEKIANGLDDGEGNNGE